jgi:hypothetical protein
VRNLFEYSVPNDFRDDRVATVSRSAVTSEAGDYALAFMRQLAEVVTISPS